MRSIKKLTATAAVVSALGMTAACGSSETDSAADTASDTAGEVTSQSPSDMDSDMDMDEESTAPGADPAANLVGPGCADYAKAVPKGKGSVKGMAQDPVAVAASNNPLLKTLVAAVSGKVNPKVDLVDTLNNDPFTVFAPVDSAFAKLPKATLNTLKKDDALLSKILTYHVIPGQIAPSDITGTQDTVQGDSVKVSGSGDNLTVTSAGSKAQVICGGVQTANATVYLIDTVLMPPM